MNEDLFKLKTKADTLPISQEMKDKYWQDLPERLRQKLLEVIYDNSSEDIKTKIKALDDQFDTASYLIVMSEAFANPLLYDVMQKAYQQFIDNELQTLAGTNKFGK